MLAETKSENNSYKLTNDIRKVFYLLYQKINKERNKERMKPKKNLQQFHQVIIILRDNKLIIARELLTLHFDLSKYVGIKLKHEICSTIKQNTPSAQHTIKAKLGNCCQKINLEMIFMNT